MNVGFCGVSCTGKTTLFNALKDKLGNTADFIPEATRSELLIYAEVTEEDLNLPELSLKFNAGLIARQVAIEMSHPTTRDCIVDNCDVTNMKSWLYFSRGYNLFGDDVNALVKQTMDWVNEWYDLILYIPFSGRITPAPHRSGNGNLYTTSLDMQDAMLSRLIFRHVRCEVLKLTAELNQEQTLDYVTKKLRFRGLHV